MIAPAPSLASPAPGTSAELILNTDRLSFATFFGGDARVQPLHENWISKTLAVSVPSALMVSWIRILV